MFYYTFLNLFMLYPNYDTNEYGMNTYTKLYWYMLSQANPGKFEHFMVLHIYHTTFKSTEVI
jgi:hypothetical protein